MEYVDAKEMTRCKTCDGTDFEYVDGKDPKCMTCRPAASTAAMDMAYEKRVREALEEIVHSEVTVKQMKDHLIARVLDLRRAQTLAPHPRSTIPPPLRRQCHDSTDSFRAAGREALFGPPSQ